MKNIFILIALICSLSAIAQVQNYKYISDANYREEVQDSDQFVVMIFSSKECLERTVRAQSCFSFERRLDSQVPSFSKKVKLVGFNTYFENYQVVSQFHITKIPTVIILKNNQVLKRLEPNFILPNINSGRLDWQTELFKQTTQEIYKIR